MSDNRNSYSSILKSIGLFGGVQVFQILVGIIKNKIVAVLLGPAGMGIVSMITSSAQIIESCTGFGLGTSGMRGIASAQSTNDPQKLGRVLSVVRKLVLFTGILGSLAIFILAKQLSAWSFGNDSYTTAFRIVCVIALFDQLKIGQTALMQGTFHYKLMAKSALWGSIVGLVVSVPLYYLYGEKAIVPVIIINSLAGLLLSFLYARKISYRKSSLTAKEVWSDGKEMLRLGMAIALTGAVGLGTTYVLRAYISNFGSIDDVGLYAAGSSFATMYINVILSAMATDYSPRLASICKDIPAFIETINRQMKLMVTIMLPLIVLFVVVIRELTIIFYSTEFLDVTKMIEWMMLGMFFRAMSWCISFAQVARGDSKVFFWNEFASSIYTVVLSVIGYHYFRFTGLGIAFFLQYFIYTIQMYILSRKRFGYYISKDALSVLAKNLLLLVVSFIVLQFVHYSIWRYIVGFVFLMISVVMAYKIMNTMIPVKESLVNVLNKVVKKNE